MTRHDSKENVKHANTEEDGDISGCRGSVERDDAFIPGGNKAVERCLRERGRERERWGRGGEGKAVIGCHMIKAR